MEPTIYKKSLVTLAVVFFTCFSGYAQVKVSGRVTDKDNVPLPGANVYIKNTTMGAITTLDGTYSLTIPDNAEKILVFSYMGYNTDTVEVGNRTTVDVVMRETTQNLDEVVVVGYGTMRKSDITGSVVSVVIKENEASTVTSFDRILQGRAAGVQVTTGNAAPGGAVDIKIRGTSSFNSSSEPLCVVDGVILNSTTQDVRDAFVKGGSSNGQESQNPLSSINPNDILSMEILKDASATAIYGSQGANGVILITTKTGTSMKPKIEYSASVQLSQRSKTIPVLDLQGYATWREEVGSNRIDPDTCIEMNWQDDAMRMAVSQNHRISISGRNDKTTYYIAGGFFNNNGIVKQTNVKQVDFRVNLDKTYNEHIKLGTKTSFSNTINNMTQGTEPNGSHNTSMIKQILSSRPYLSEASLDAADEDVIEGPRAWLTDYEDKSTDYRIVPLVYADFKITKWLSFRSTVGADYRRKIRARSYGLGLYAGAMANGKAGVSTLQSLRYNLDEMFSVNKIINNVHRINVTAGITLNSTYVENSAIENQQFPNMDWGSDGMILGNLPINEAFGESLTTLFSALMRGVYSYNDKYIITATIRADGSSKFSKANRFSYFPSFAVAWRVGEEEFIKNIGAISNLKFRAGWGSVGNQSISPYNTLTTYTTKLYAKPDGGAETGYRASAMANPDLKWETTNQWNAGMDLAIFNNRFNAIIDVYEKNTKDLLQKISLPNSSGYSDMWINRGIIQNKGVELSLYGDVIANTNFNWNIGGNISFNKNKIIDSGCELGTFGTNQWKAFFGQVVTNSTYMKKEANIFIEGQPVALFYGLQTRGIVQEGDDAPSAYGVPSTPGSVYFVDQDGDNNITDQDFVIIGDPNPKFTYGLFTSFSFKKLTLDLNFNGVYGNDVLNGNLIIENQSVNSNTRNIRADAYFQAWRPDAVNTDYPALNQYPSTVEISDRLIEDGSYLRLSSATLNYRFDMKNIVQISSFNISLTGRNLFLLSDYSGWDPEVNSFTGNPLKVGIDWGSYPNFRAIIFALGITF